MPDWVGLDGSSTSRRYRAMAEQVSGVSPSYEAICLRLADDADVVHRIDTLPTAKRQPNLLLGAVRYLGGPVSSWPAVREFLLTRWDDVAATMREHRTQTNEAGRCATLLPVLARLPGPLALLEVGASAGLCLYPDRYAYRYRGPDGTEHEVGSSTLRLDCEISGAVPLPDALPAVVWRAGLDLAPVSVTDAAAVRWLEALVWPEQYERFGVLRAAVDIARADPPRIERGDLVTDLAGMAAAAPADATLVVFHSAVLAYVDGDDRAAFRTEVERIAATRTTYWVSNEAPGVVAATDVPGAGAGFVLALDGRPVAITGPHGQRLDWLV
jgi:hypothetical protein